MVRSLVMVAFLVLASAAASAQVSGQFNPSTPTIPAPPPSPTPPAATPGLAPVPPVLGKSSRQEPPEAAAVPRLTPGRPSPETHNDRAIRCVHQGTALGVPPGAIGQYTGECVNSQ